MNNQNKLITLGLFILVIIILILSRIPSGVDRLKEKIKMLELSNKEQQEVIDSSLVVLQENEIEKKIIRDSIKLLTIDNKRLTKEVKREKAKYKDIAGKYEKQSNDSLVVQINNLTDTLSKEVLVINREAGESCLEINDSLQVAKVVIEVQDSLIHNGTQIILKQEDLIAKQKQDSVQQNNIIDAQQQQLSNKSEEVHLLESQNKEDNAKHIKREIGLVIIAVVFLLL